MSAYIVEQEHIQYLVNAAQDWNLYFSNPVFETVQKTAGPMSILKPDVVGQMLLDTNFRSVNSRYGLTMESRPADKYEHYRRTTSPNTVQVIKSIQCLQHQCSEAADWKDSAADRFLKALLAFAITKLPGYEAAIWGVPPSFKHSQRGKA